MIIVNAVECTTKNTLFSLVDSYLTSKSCTSVFTDDKRVKEYVDSKYTSIKCVYNESLVALWLTIDEDSALIITDINNICSDVYADLSCSYTVISIDDVTNRSGI